MTRGIYKAIVKEYRRGLSPAKRRASYRARFRGNYPFKAEKRLQGVIRKIYKWYSDKVMLVAMRWAHIYPVQSVRRDSFEDEIYKYTEELRAEAFPADLVGSFNLSAMFQAIMVEIRKVSEEDLEAYFIKRFGKPMPYTEPWWETVKQQWLSEINVRLGGAADAYLQKVQNTVLSYIRAEKSFDELVERLRTISSSFTEHQAKFLARDLTGKLTSKMTKELHTSVGINYYLWLTAADERVRGRPGGIYPNAVPSHWDMDGLLCSWLDSTIVSYDYGRTWQKRTPRMPFVAPGMEWQCRCIGSPFDLDILQEADRELNAE